MHARLKIRKTINRMLSFTLALTLGLSGAGTSLCVTAEAATHDNAHTASTENTFTYSMDGVVKADGKITKSAEWINIDKGLAEITITEEDIGSSKESLAGADYVFVMDSSHSMDFIMSGVSSFCIYPTHCYQYNGRWCKLYDHGDGTLVYYINSPTDQSWTGETEIIRFYDDPSTPADEKLAQDNCFYSLMFDYDLWSYDDSFYLFTGYIFSCDGEDPTKWRYIRYENARISKAIIDTYAARNADPSYWSAEAQEPTESRAGRYETAAQRIASDPELADGVAQYGYNASKPPLFCGTYSGLQDYSANYTTCGHYDEGGSRIGFQFFDDQGNHLSKDESDNLEVNNPGKLRWGYTDGRCVSKMTATRNTLRTLVDKIGAADPSAQIAFIPFGYNKDNGAITDLYSVPFTTDRNAVKNAVSSTISQGATTYETWISRLDTFMADHNQTRADRQVKVILISDGMPTDTNVQSNTYSSLGEKARQVAAAGYCGGSYEKALLEEVIPYTFLAMKNVKPGYNLPVHGITYPGRGYSNMVVNTVAVGYTNNAASQGAMSGGFSDTAQMMIDITRRTNGSWVFLGSVENGTARLNTDNLAMAVEQGTEATPVYIDKKVLTDTVADEFEVVSVETENGTAEFSGNTVTWNVPTGEHYSEKCSNTLKVQVKLKDEFRFKVGDTCYVTNNDDVNGGCYMTYSVDGTNGSVATATPHLKYGVVNVNGTKHWTIEGSEPDEVDVVLERKLPAGEYVFMAEQTVLKTDGYHYAFSERVLEGERCPLVAFDNDGTAYTYRINEPDDFKNYRLVDSVTEETGNIITNDIYNEPHKATVIIEKTDPVHGNGAVPGAEFTVYEYTGTGDVNAQENYREYKGRTSDEKTPNGAAGLGTVSGNDTVKLTETDVTGIYQSTDYLYYTPVNMGHFMVKETTTPHGYVGDYTDISTVDEINAGTPELYKPYFFTLDEDIHEQTIHVTNNGDTFENIPVNTVINILKKGEVPKVSFDEEGNVADISYEQEVLRDAWYVLRASTDIYDTFGNIAFHKGDIIDRDSAQKHSLSEPDMAEMLENVINDQTAEVTASYLDKSEDLNKNFVLTVEETYGKSKLCVSWEDGENIPVYLVSPLGTVYDEESYGDFTTRDEKSVTFTLDEVIKGDWNIIMTGAALGNINVSIFPWTSDSPEDSDTAETVTSDDIDKTKLYVSGYIRDEENPANNAVVFSNGEKTDFVYVTGADGLVTIKNLPLGTYEVVEVKAPAGYVRNTQNSSQMADIVCDNDYTGEVTKDVVFINDRQKLDLTGNTTPDKEVDEKDPAISVSKTSDKFVYKNGETIHYAVTVTNTGAVDLKDVRITDFFEERNGVVLEDIDYLAAGESRDYIYDIPVPENTPDNTKLLNVVTAEGTEVTDESVSDNTVARTVKDEDDCKVVVIENGIAVTKQADKKIYTHGEIVYYTIRVSNTAPSSLYDVLLEDNYVNEELGTISFMSADIDCVSETEDGNILIDELPGNSTVTLQFYVKVSEDAASGDYDNLVTVKGNTKEDPSDPDNEVKEDKDDETVTVINPQIDVKKVTNKKNYKVGDTVQFVITVTNTGDCELDNVYLKDYLDGSFTSCLTETEQEILFTDDTAFAGRLSPDEAVSFAYEYVAKETDGDVENTVTAHGTTVPKEPQEPVIPVEDEDDEVIHVGRYVGIRKLGRSDSEMHGVEGALIGLFAKEDIYAASDILNPDAEPVIPAGTLVEKAYTDSFGYAQFKTDLPLGVYEARELEAADGYYKTDAVCSFDSKDLVYNDQVSFVHRGGEILDAQTVLYVYLKDDNTLNELANAGLQISDEDGNPVNVWITKNTNGDGYAVKGLTPGKVYTLTENYAREGYINSIIRSFATGGGEIVESDNEHVSFILDDAVTSSDENGKLMEDTIPDALRITITNDFTRGNVKVNKLGEVLENWTLLDKVNNFFKSIFSYILGSLKDVEFKVVAKEDIIHPDGVTGVLYRAGDPVPMHISTFEVPAVAKSDKFGMVSFDDLYLGKYSMIEIKGVDGYKISDKPIDFTLQYIDDKTPVVEASAGTIDVINERQKVRVAVTKKSEETNELLKGAEFGLYNDEDIKDYKGNVLIKKGTLLENGVTDGDGLLVFESDIPLARYYIKEITPPPGYALNDKEYRFDVTREENTMSVIEVDFEVFDPLGDIELLLTKTGDEKSFSGGVIRYKFDDLKNVSPVSLDNFTLTDDLPEEVTLKSVSTGTYSYDTRMTVYYQLNNKSDWFTWRNVSTKTSSTLNVSDLKIGSDRITAFKFVFDECPADFTQTSAPSCEAVVSQDVSKSAKITNNAKLTGEWMTKKAEKKASAVTDIVKTPAPKTGDLSDMVKYINIMIITAAGFIIFAVNAVLSDKKKRRVRMLNNGLADSDKTIKDIHRQLFG